MRTLKKVLALTVVLATLLSISSFAAFSDEESIDESFVDAVNLLGALNVMTGDTEGTFRPNDTISRAEAAKMIYVIRNGGVDDQAAGWTGMSTFSDVTPGVWFEGYVNYCASLGIIAGIGGGKFNPSGAVTGVELAKMLLVVADYRPDIEGYTGAGWNLNVIRDAQTVGMFEGYTLAYSAAATRQQAAQLFSNAILETQMAVYIGDTRVNDLASITNTGTIGSRFFDLRIATGVLTQIPHVTLPTDYDVVNETVDATNGHAADLNLRDNEGTIVFSVLDNNRYTNDSANFVFDVDPELLYQEVEVIYQEEKTSSGLDRRDNVYAVLPTGGSDVYETTMDAITIELDDDSMPKNLTENATNYNPVTIQFEGYNGSRAKVMENDIPVITNLYETTDFVLNDVTSAEAEWDERVYVLDADYVSKLATTSTAPVRLVDVDSDGNLDIAFITTPYYGTVSSYNADRFEFTTNAQIDGDNITTSRREENFERFTFEDDIEQDDVISVNIDVTTGEMLYTVALVEPTVGTVTRVYSTLPDNQVVIGGETYGFYGLLFDGKPLDAAGVELDASDYHSELGDEVTVYTDGKYIISAQVEPATLGTGFAFVKNYNLEGNSFDSMLTDSKAVLVELVLPNGDTVVKEYDVTEAVSSSANRSGYYSYNDDDAEIKSLLPEMIGNIVEYTSSGNYVAFRVTNRTATSNTELAPVYYDGVDKYTYSSSNGMFRNDARRGVDVSDSSVFFLPTYRDSSLGDVKDNIRSVAVITGAELRGVPTISTENNSSSTIMQMVSSLQNGIRTINFAALDEGSTVSDTGVFAYTLTNDWDQDEDEDDGYRVEAVLSDSDSDESSIVELDHSDVLGNKIYRVTTHSDGTHTFDQVIDGETVNGATTVLGSIRGARNNRVTIEDSNGHDDTYYVTDDTVIFVVDIDARGSMSRISLGSFNDLDEAALVNGSTTQYCNNIIFEYDTDLNITVAFVEAVGMDVENLISYEDNITALNLTGIGLPNDASANVSVSQALLDGEGMGYRVTGTVLTGTTVTVDLETKTGWSFDSSLHGNTSAVTAEAGYTVNDVIFDDNSHVTVEMSVAALEVTGDWDITFNMWHPALSNTNVGDYVPTSPTGNNTYGVAMFKDVQIVWQEMSDNTTSATVVKELTATDTFESGHYYRAVITATAIDGFQFKDTYSGTVKILEPVGQGSQGLDSSVTAEPDGDVIVITTATVQPV